MDKELHKMLVPSSSVRDGLKLNRLEGVVGCANQATKTSRTKEADLQGTIKTGKNAFDTVCTL